MTIKQGCLYGVLALGVYITYSILDFPDLSVDGTLTLGGVISGILIFHGVSPWLALLAAFSAGVAAGCVTGLLHVKLHIQPLLCGILVMTALLSVNLMIIKAGTNNMNIVYFSQTHLTVAEVFPISLIPEYVGGFELRPLAVAVAVALICKILLDWYLRTKSGMLLRAAGSNAQYVVQLARNPGMSKILGLALGNGSHHTGQGERRAPDRDRFRRHRPRLGYYRRQPAAQTPVPAEHHQGIARLHHLHDVLDDRHSPAMERSAQTDYVGLVRGGAGTQQYAG